jgi:ribosomal protein S2
MNNLTIGKNPQWNNAETSEKEVVSKKVSKKEPIDMTKEIKDLEKSLKNISALYVNYPNVKLSSAIITLENMIRELKNGI